MWICLSISALVHLIDLTTPRGAPALVITGLDIIIAADEGQTKCGTRHNQSFLTLGDNKDDKKTFLLNFLLVKNIEHADSNNNDSNSKIHRLGLQEC